MQYNVSYAPIEISQNTIQCVICTYRNFASPTVIDTIVSITSSTRVSEILVACSLVVFVSGIPTDKGYAYRKVKL